MHEHVTAAEQNQKTDLMKRPEIAGAKSFMPRLSQIKCRRKSDKSPFARRTNQPESITKSP
jgi:hypothetical protein